MNSYSSYNYPLTNTHGISNYQDERLIGGFAFPFLLGGVTGAAIAPAFWRPGYGYNRPPYYGPNFGPGPVYGPGFGPYR